MSDTVRLLHVDGGSDSVDVYPPSLEREPDRITIEAESSVEDALEYLTDEDVHVVVSEYDLPDRDGIEFLEAVREEYPDLPFVLYTDHGSEQVASDAISAGVTDYLRKDAATEWESALADRVHSYVERARRQRDRRCRLDAIDSTREAVGILDEDGQFVYVNEAYAELYGYDTEEMIGERWELIYRDEDLQRIHGEILPIVDDEGYWHGETVGRRADGSTFLKDHTVATTTDGGFVCTARDLSDHEKHERFVEAIFNNTYTFVGLMEPDGTLLEANETALSLGGLDREEVVGKRIWDTYWFQSNEAARTAARDAVERARDGEPYRNEIRLQGSDCEAVVDFSVRPVTTEDGEVVLLVPEGRDVTDRKQQVRRLETLIDNLPGIAYRCRNESGWPMESVRGEVEALTGYPPSLLETEEGFFGDEIVHSDDRERVWDAVQSATDRNEPFEITYRIVTESGATKWVWEQGQALDSSDGGDDVLEGFITDITERKRVTEELREEREFTEQALNTLEDVFYVVGVDGGMRRWNSRLSEVTGYTDAEIAEMQAIDFFPTAEHDRIENAIEETLTTGKAVVESELLTADGDRIPYEFTGTELTDTDGDVTGLVGTGRDITERHRYEELLTLLHERTRAMARADSRDGIADVAVEIADELLGLNGTVVYEFDGGTELVPLVWSDSFGRRLEAIPTARKDESTLWDTFVDGEERLLEDVADDAVIRAFPVSSALLLPVNNHGVLMVGTEEGSLTTTQRKILRLIRESLDAALDRAKRERDLRKRDRQLQRQNDSLEQLNRLNELIREINQTLVRSSTQSKIRKRVCEQLAGSDQYSFAWFGSRETVHDDVVPRTWSGVDSAYVERLQESDVHEPLWELIDAAFREDSIQVVRNILERPRWEAHRNEALNHQYRAVAVVPVIKGNHAESVIVIHADEGDLFDEDELTVLEELGQTIGYAVRNVERARAIRTNDHTEIELTIDDRRLFTNRLADALDASVEFVGAVPDDGDSVRFFLRMNTTDADALEVQLSELDTVVDERILSVDDDSCLCQLTVATPPLLKTLQGNGQVLTLRAEGGTTTCSIALIGDVMVRSVVEELQLAYPSTELLARRERDVSVGTREAFREQLVDQLTEKQFDALKTAYFGGIYEWPRSTTNEELAETRGISASTFQYHLRAAERKVVSMILSPA